ETTDAAAAGRAYAALAETATSDTSLARALQAQARCLLRAGEKEKALALLSGPLTETRFQAATDLDGRLIPPNAQLMAIELITQGSVGEGTPTPDSEHESRLTDLVSSLQHRLDDYADTTLSAPQRRFLMRELQRLVPDRINFPTLEAEDLAA